MKLNKNDTNAIGAFLGSDSEFEGQLTFQGTIRIDGRYKGNISVDGNLIIGPSGRVTAEISASNMIISGEVTGNMTAGTNIEVQASGKVYGNLTAPTVTIHEGAVFQGRCHTGKSRDGQPESLPKLHSVGEKQADSQDKPKDQVTKSA
jgi:cytoskeletal protein CcmA (bactofilin family)